VSTAIDFSVAPVFVGRIDWHPTSGYVVASRNGNVHTLAVKDLQFIEDRLFDIEPLSPPSDEAGELKDELECRKPGHAGLLAGKA
jgi:hypothetical protein